MQRSRLYHLFVSLGVIFLKNAFRDFLNALLVQPTLLTNIVHMWFFKNSLKLKFKYLTIAHLPQLAKIYDSGMLLKNLNKKSKENWWKANKRKEDFRRPKKIFFWPARTSSSLAKKRRKKTKDWFIIHLFR